MQSNSGWKYYVAVWWPDEGGYGAVSEFDSEKAAMEKRQALKEMGYGQAHNPVHVWRKKSIREMIAHD